MFLVFIPLIPFIPVKKNFVFPVCFRLCRLRTIILKLKSSEFLYVLCGEGF